MASDWLNHKQLAIIKGIQKTPGDSLSAEKDLVVFNLMTDGAVTLDDWSPNIPAVKGGGIWTDSPINDGRQLLTAPVGNVTEKMTINITDRTYLSVNKQLSALNQMALDCRDYWQSLYQIEPVWLVWASGCNTPALPQYALLYNIEIAPTYQKSDQPTIQVNITLEREPYWRGIPPGANPKFWTYYVNASHPQFNSGVASLVALSDHLITQTINNKFEWTPASYGLQTTPITQNYIDILAAQVPGDASALVELSIADSTSSTVANVYIGLSSKKLSGTGHDGINRFQSYILNIGDFSSGVSTKTNSGSSSLGVKSNNSSVIFYNGTRTVTGVDANYVNFARWGESIANGIKLDRELMRGTFAIFVRARNASVAGVLGDMKMRILIEEIEDSANQYRTIYTGQDVSVPLFPAATGARFPIAYMGSITLPFNNKTVQSPLGYGLQLQEANNNLRVTLQQQVLLATANRTMEAIDVIFMPIDEGLFQIVLPTPDGGGVATQITLADNTGYLSRGDSSQNAIGYETNSNSGGINVEVRGSSIMLSPHKDQHLHFLTDYFDGLGSYNSIISATMTVRLNIVPRWSGIRDT
jgi:hypothetical protein